MGRARPSQPLIGLVLGFVFQLVSSMIPTFWPRLVLTCSLGSDSSLNLKPNNHLSCCDLPWDNST